jgi:hypothetical protein
LPTITLGGGSSAVAASSHAACARFRGTDPMITYRTRRQLARELGHPDTSGTIPEARWMRAMAFERLVRDDRFASRVATVAVGRLGLPRPDAVVVAGAGRDRVTTLAHLVSALAIATKANKATLIHEPAVPFPGFEDKAATDVLPDFFVVAPRRDALDRAWLIAGDAKDYERVRSRIDDARLLKGFLQVAFGAEAAAQWSRLPDGLDVHRFGVLAVPRNAFLQPQAIVEDLRDHRIEVETRLRERRDEAAQVVWTSKAVPAKLVPHLDAAFDPESCVTCSLFAYCRSELRARTDPESLLIELGVPSDARPHVLGIVDGTGEGTDAAPPEVAALVTATVTGAPFPTGQYRVDPAGEPGTVNVVVAKSDAAALGVHGLGVQLVTEAGLGDWAFHVFDNPQSVDTRLSVVRAIGDAVQESIASAHQRNPEAPDPVHIVVPDKGTADVLASIADALAGVELSRLRWAHDLEVGRPALTFDGEPATIPDPLTATERTGVSFLLEEDRARALSLRIPTIDVRAVLARHLVAGGPAINSYRLDYLVEWAAATGPVDHRALSDAIEASAHTPGVRLSNARSDAIHEALVGPDGHRPDPSVPFDADTYKQLVLEELEYKATTLVRALEALDLFPESQLRGVYRAIERDAQVVWRRRHAFHASDLVRFGRTYRWWRDQLVESIESDGTCHDQLLSLTNPHAAEQAATDAGTRHIARARVLSLSPLVLDVKSRSIVAGNRIVLLHVNGVQSVETQATSVVHQGGSFRIDGLSIGALSRDGIADDAPRTRLAWTPAVVPSVAVGDELVIADYDWYHSYVSGRYLGIDRPKADTAAAPKPSCSPDDFQNHPGDHQFCCKPHEAAEAEWSDILAGRREQGELNPEVWPPVQDEDGFDIVAVGDPVGDPTVDAPEAAPDDLSLDDLD